MLNARFLKTFLSLCETRHFTKTADQLNMTQSGVSQHLKKLETDLGTLLFHRIGKQIERFGAPNVAWYSAGAWTGSWMQRSMNQSETCVNGRGILALQQSITIDSLSISFFDLVQAGSER